jgi:hypothetical protein
LTLLPPLQYIDALAPTTGPAGTPGIDDHDDDDDDDDDTQVTCAPAFVTVDQGNPHYSAFSIDVSVDPGRGRGQPSVEH